MAPQYPSRAAYKLRYALDNLRVRHHITIQDRLCLDLGCAHGGFVQILLEEGARRIYAVDVGYGILDYTLRIDPRVVVRERHNLRYLSLDWFCTADRQILNASSELNTTNANVLFCTCDVSFISSATVLHTLAHFHAASSFKLELLLLVKPQFEASRLTQKGVIHEETLRQKLVAQVTEKAIQYDFRVIETIPVLPRGAKGNQEYILYAERVALSA